jgi:chromosomal replication initiation ATPase DnaA
MSDIYQAIITEPIIIDRKQIIINAVCKAKNVGFDYINTKSRDKEKVYARHLIMFFLLENGFSSTESALVFDRDHASAIHARKTINNFCDTDKSVRFEVNKLRMMIDNCFKK